jgi:hypothetical protein
MTTVLARGVRGDLVEQLQAALTHIKVPAEGGGEEPAIAAIDGDFGRTTQVAVQRVQGKLGRPVSGVVDAELWEELTKTEWPGRFERNLSLVAAFEGHGYTKAAGNWDKAGITWGVIGFILITRGKVKKKTVLQYGPLRDLLKEAFATHEATMTAAFGDGQAKVLKQMLDAAPDDLYKFAVQVSDGKKNFVLRPEWQEAFAVLGSDPGIRDLQRAYAKRLYYDPAIEQAEEFGNEFDMTSERTDQLFFDIQVNNGGLGRKQEKPKAKAALKDLLTANPMATLAEKLNVIAKVLAASRPKFAKDINERKGTICNGFGRVHGKDYRIDGWGIKLDATPVVPPAPPPAPEPTPEPLQLRLGVLGLDATQQSEQLDLAAGAKKLGLTEPGIELVNAGLWPAGNGIEPLAGGGVKSLSLRGLLGASGATLIGPKGDALLHGVNLMFREPVGVLAVMGQSTPLPAALAGDHLVVARGDRHYVGVALRKSDQLHLVRQRLRGSTREQSLLDVTEIRPQLAECRMLMLYAGYGVPTDILPGSGVRWREWLAPFKASPIVLGWFGNVRMPRDAARQVVASDFLAHVAALEPGANLQTLCEKHGEDIVQQWGEACHRAFHVGTQKYLWLDQAIPALDLSLSGAAAIGQDGKIWHANPKFGATGEAAMKAVVA